MRTLSKPIIAITLLAVAFSINSCINYTKGSGNVVLERKAVANFSKLYVDGAFDVFIKQGEIADLQVEIDDNLQNKVIVLNEDERLSISTEGTFRGVTEMKLYITVTNITDMKFDGAVDVVAKNPMKFDELYINADGAVEIDMNLDVSKLKMVCDGAADVKLTGKCDRAKIGIDGAGELDANDFEIEDLEIDIDGAGSAKVNVRDNLKASVDGAGSIRYLGTPNVNSKIEGAGSIRKQ